MNQNDDMSKIVRWWAVSPGSMGAVSHALKIFGPRNLNPGGWGTPVYVRASLEEARFFVDLLSDLSAALGEPRVYTLGYSDPKTPWESDS